MTPRSLREQPTLLWRTYPLKQRPATPHRPSSQTQVAGGGQALSRAARVVEAKRCRERSFGTAWRSDRRGCAASAAPPAGPVNRDRRQNDGCEAYRPGRVCSRAGPGSEDGVDGRWSTRQSRSRTRLSLAERICSMRYARSPRPCGSRRWRSHRGPNAENEPTRRPCRCARYGSRNLSRSPIRGRQLEQPLSRSSAARAGAEASPEGSRREARSGG